MSLSVNPISVRPAFKGNYATEPEKQPKEGVSTQTAVIGALSAMAIAGTAVYLAMSGKTKAATEAAGEVVKPAEEAVTKTLEKLPSRNEVLESLGLKLNDVKRLAKENGELYTGTHSYTARNGVNVEEKIFNGRVESRKIITEKTIDNPTVKYYDYYEDKYATGAEPSLRKITTKKDDGRIVVFRNQTALKQYREAIRYTPKTPEQIKALEEQGIKYEVTTETLDFTEAGYGTREHIKEIYTYPETSPIKTKEVFYGAGNRDRIYGSSDLHAGKEITLTFREPIQTSNPHYKADGFRFEATDDGFDYVDLKGFTTHDRIDVTSSYSDQRWAIPFKDKNVIDAIEAELPLDVLKKIRFGD